MGLLEIILIGISLSVDSFSVGFSIGAIQKQFSVKEWLKIALFMSFFQAFFPLLGWFAGMGIKGIIENYDHWISFILLVIVGGKMIKDGFKNQDTETCTNYSNTWIIIGLSIATSIDALIVGLSFGMLNTSPYLPVLIFGICTFAFVNLALYLGKHIGHRINFRFEIIGGLALIAIGVKILYEHLYI